MKKFCFIWAIAIAIVTAVSCQKEDDALTMLATEYSVASEGVSQKISFNANADWTISTDADWISFDKNEGTAGDAAVTMTVAANTTYEVRSAKVTINAGDKNTVFTVKQGESTVFTSEVLYEISAEAQTIQFDLNTNLKYSCSIEDAAKSWISSTDVKSAPVEKMVTFAIKSNSELGPREGKIFITAGVSTYCLIVKQNAEFTVMNEGTAAYYANSSYIVDSDWNYTSFQEWMITLSGESESVVLAINSANVENPLETIPEGEYEVDATGVHAENTFTIKATDGSEPFYTVITEDGKETVIEDGIVNVTKTETGYEISCVLVDMLGKEHKYSYAGELTIGDKSVGANDNGTSFHNNYATYFTGGVNQWAVSLVVNSPAPGQTEGFHYLYFTLNGAAGNDLDGSELPTGTFALEESVYDESLTWATGTLKATTGKSMEVSATAYVGEENIYYELKNSTITVTKNDNGTYSFAIKGDASQTKHNEDYDLVPAGDDVKFDATYENVKIDVDTKSSSTPIPDGNFTVSKVMSSAMAGMWYGTPYEGCTSNVFVSGYSGGVDYNFTVYLTFVTDDTFKWEVNFGTRYNNTPIPSGKYTFSNTPDKMNIVPGKNYNYVQNGYTGTKFQITGGDVTYSGTKIEYNLILKNPNDESTCTFKGSHDASWYYSRDYSDDKYKGQVALVL